MGAWPDVAAARDDLRRFLNDGPTDRPAKQKQILGNVDGVNRQFFTFDDRIVVGSLIVSVNFVDLAGTEFTLTDPIMGEITLVTPPAAQTTVRARYYFQFFTDVELEEALKLATGEIVESDDVTQIVFGMKNTTLNFAGHFAFVKQAIRWAHLMSSKFLVEDEPVEGETSSRPNLFRQIASDYLKHALDMRTSYYTRHGRRNAPAFTVFKPNIPPSGPRR